MGDELKLEIEQLQHQIAVREKDYKNAVNFHEKYETLKGIREDIRELKKRLASIYDEMKGDGKAKDE
jgi:flagellar motility protein MotE (MotC chaperone)